MRHTNDLGRDKIFPLVCRLAIPTMLAQMVSVLYSIVDRIYIGNIAGIGDLALAGVGVCGPIVTLLSSFASLVGLGGAPILAMRLGEGRPREAERVVSNGFLTLLILSAVLTSVFLLLKDRLLMVFGASEATFGYADTYLTIYTCGTVFSLLATGLNSYLIAQGFSGLGMFTVVLGAVLNIVLDPIFIFLLHMDVAGAAIATVISQIASCAAVLCCLLRKKATVRLTWGGFDWALIRRILAFGFPTFLIFSTDSIILIILNGLLQHYGGALEGDILVTCATIVQSWFSLISLPMGGITTGSQPVVSYNFGANRPERHILHRRAVRHILLADDPGGAHGRVRAVRAAVHAGRGDRHTQRAVHPDVHRHDNPAGRAVHAGGRDDGHGTGQALAVLLAVPQEPVSGEHAAPAAPRRRGGHLLVRAYRRRRRCLHDRLRLRDIHPQSPPPPLRGLSNARRPRKLRAPGCFNK